jgi:hypothetical protein
MRTCTYRHTDAYTHTLKCAHLQPDSLMLLAAVLTADDCLRLRAEHYGSTWRDAAYGFAMQVGSGLSCMCDCLYLCEGLVCARVWTLIEQGPGC